MPMRESNGGKGKKKFTLRMKKYFIKLPVDLWSPE